ncbi:hypothetical protein WN55_02645 [Dufourea novaeangliae]|uniref:Uncharacterized protein n=1 Tax=Dufourea novaeangliae TaxID=178035 RepID=A0A154PJI3_DUFNO|nr:hypothetical protein WN55_02645 [Dufourea novaeangliae]
MPWIEEGTKQSKDVLIGFVKYIDTPTEQKNRRWQGLSTWSPNTWEKKIKNLPQSEARMATPKAFRKDDGQGATSEGEEGNLFSTPAAKPRGQKRTASSPVVVPEIFEKDIPLEQEEVDNLCADLVEHKTTVLSILLTSKDTTEKKRNLETAIRTYSGTKGAEGGASPELLSKLPEIDKKTAMNISSVRTLMRPRKEATPLKIQNITQEI